MRNLLLRKQDFDPEIKVVMERDACVPMTTHAHSLRTSNGFRIPQSHYRQPVIGHMKHLKT